jgi:hypothetical protein
MCLSHQPGAGSGTGQGCWHGPLKPHAKTDYGRLEQEERSLPHSIDTCTGAVAWRLLAGDSCRRGNGSGQVHFRRAVVLSVACLRAGYARGAAWCAGRASPAARRGYGAPRRNLAPLGCAAAASSAGQALGGAPAWPRQVRRASGLAAAGNGWNAASGDNPAPALRFLAREADRSSEWGRVC